MSICFNCIIKECTLLCELVEFVISSSKDNSDKCPLEWKNFFSNSSPACAILRPSDKLFSILKEIRTLGPPTDITELRCLQTQCPMLFGQKKPIPKNALANAVNMAFFPQLPVIRSRGSYRADRVRKEKICPQHTTGHPRHFYQEF